MSHSPKLVKKQKIEAKIDNNLGKIWFDKIGQIPFGYWFKFNLCIKYKLIAENGGSYQILYIPREHSPLKASRGAVGRPPRMLMEIRRKLN